MRDTIYGDADQSRDDPNDIKITSTIERFIPLMKTNTLKALAHPDDIHQFVYGLWAPGGPIQKSHGEEGPVFKLIDDFARMPRIFTEMTDPKLEWTHFAPWWSVIFLCQYSNPHIRDLRYLHEIKHAATMAYSEGMTISTFRNKIRDNEHEASAFSEMLIYLDFPELRPLTFQHPIFMDRFLFPEGDYTEPNENLLGRWKTEPDLVAKEFQFIRANLLTAKPEDVDMTDPQVTWLRRYPTQGMEWIKIWTPRYQSVEEAMVKMRDDRAPNRLGRTAALDRHIEFLTSPEVAGNAGIPFYSEAQAFRQSYDDLIAEYDRKMGDKGLQPVKHVTGAVKQTLPPPPALTL